MQTSTSWYVLSPPGPFLLKAPHLTPLQEKWNTTSALADNAQVVEIFSSFIKLPYADRFAYSQQVTERNVQTTASLPEGDQLLLARVRTSGERQAGGLSWLRTYYGPDSDMAFAALLAARPDPPELPMFQDADRYDYGREWERVFTRMPEMLDPYRPRTPEQYATANREALEQCVQAEREEREAVEEEGADWDEDGPWWMDLYSAYHYKAQAGLIAIADEETLRAVPPANGKVLVVWYDVMGRAVKSTRLSAQETWAVEGLEENMAGAIVEHDEWKRAYVGVEYDWDGPLGPPHSEGDG